MPDAWVGRWVGGWVGGWAALELILFVFLMGGGVDLEESLEESFSYWATVCTFRECLEINLTNVSTCT